MITEEEFYEVCKQSGLDAIRLYGHTVNSYFGRRHSTGEYNTVAYMRSNHMVTVYPIIDEDESVEDKIFSDTYYDFTPADSETLKYYIAYYIQNEKNFKKKCRKKKIEEL